MSTDRDIFVDAYIEALYFADRPEDAPIDALLSGKDDEQQRHEARDFFDAHEADILTYPEGIRQAGHDLWLTRQGHGAGFWENEGNPAADALDAAAHALGECYVELGDDGFLYVL